MGVERTKSDAKLIDHFFFLRVIGAVAFLGIALRLWPRAKGSAFNDPATE